MTNEAFEQWWENDRVQCFPKTTASNKEQWKVAFEAGQAVEREACAVLVEEADSCNCNYVKGIADAIRGRV